MTDDSTWTDLYAPKDETGVRVEANELKEEELKLREEDIQLKEKQIDIAKKQLNLQSWHVIALFVSLAVALLSILLNSINMFLVLRK